MIDAGCRFCQTCGVSRRAHLHVACAVALALGCSGKKQTDKAAGAKPEKRPPDAAVRKPLPDKTTKVGFQLPATSRSVADRGVSIVDRGKGKPIELRLGFKPGDKQTIELLMTARIGKTEGRAAITYSTEVVSADASTGGLLQLTFRDVTMSAKPDKVRSAAVAELGKKLNGRSMRARVSADGRATVDSTQPDLAKLLARLQLDPAQLFSNMYPRFPAEKLGIGAKWLTQLESQRDGVTESVDLTYELANAVDNPRGQLITVDLIGKIKVTGTKASGSGNLRGQIVLIPSRGLITKATLRQDVRIKSADQAVGMSMLVDVIEKSGS